MATKAARPKKPKAGLKEDPAPVKGTVPLPGVAGTAGGVADAVGCVAPHPLTQEVMVEVVVETMVLEPDVSVTGHTVV